MQKGEAETDINCLLCASFCAKGFPCIISYIPHHNTTRQTTRPHLTNAETGGSKRLSKLLGLPEQASKEARTQTRAVCPQEFSTLSLGVSPGPALL